MDQQQRDWAKDMSQQRTNPWLFSIQIGFFAGLLWGVVRFVAYQFKFTVELPGFILEPFFHNSFLKSGWGFAAGIGGYIIFSIVAALLYKVFFGRLEGPWPGILYGLFWWAVLFLGIGPVLAMTKKVTLAGWNTFYTELCVFLLWGVFIGYSIAFEFTDEASREPLGVK